ncbi:hypothetical protein SDRG_07250 [Saprolegnia diclina VS20]|uniref:Uncharacterized protein n=1 Tax=Saprolegnia diclina (strain VS20) TaxID=1156394 RepID=T0RRE6_SAPDV|nr:hypothetical protein SDRG_07250 [Saprolegnia diclina VS20]EQC35008.1 hypothetical protein SDRG_07250 [Saprolegnia diclina VS20]|eukprot:XP_008611292.1 hypothetical protein SDRG_07250 [Saprolegnia diclina VS20]
MHLGHHSFYYRYLSTLPAPESIQNLTIDELASLQDPSLVKIAGQRNAEIVTWYERLTDRLFRLYRELFNATSFSFETFRFAWQTIQARTFGRRLPWTALVPLADMLNRANHANFYAYWNKTFERHSSIGYKRGDQFNSYDRHPHYQLLFDFGFALRENEWDYLDMDLHLDESSDEIEPSKAGPRGGALYNYCSGLVTAHAACLMKPASTDLVMKSNQATCWASWTGASEPDRLRGALSSRARGVISCTYCP